jgi:FtsP/CotA-like multicopper oxidase with cupredoxin domain/peroxiredoxin
MSGFSKLVAYSIILGLSIISICLAQENLPPIKSVHVNDRTQLLERATPLKDLSVFESRNGALSVVLDARIAKGQLGNREVELASYNGQFAGPIICVRPGDKLEVFLKNDLPAENVEATGRNGDDDPHGFTTTNLHTHGLNVSPLSPADNVFLEIAPGETRKYIFTLPREHGAGTFFYHPHKHGSVAYQVASGMAGALVVKGGIDAIPEIAAATNKILLLQQINLLERQTGGYYLDPNIFYDETQLPRPFIVETINGQDGPLLTMRPGEIQRWRLIHSGIEDGIRLMFATADGMEHPLPQFYEIARDGIPLSNIENPQDGTIQLYPGYRSDVLVKAPDIEGVYFLRDDAKSPKQSLRKRARPTNDIAVVKVQGQPRKMQLPKDADLAKYRPKSIAKTSIHVTRTIELNSESGFKINGTSFDPNKVEDVFRINSAEEWRLTASGGMHPFHVHVNPFEVVGYVDIVDGKQVDKYLDRPYWKDTLLIEDGMLPTIVRTRFERFAGKTVMHCHILDHEDRGMMHAIRIVRENGELAIGEDQDSSSRGLGELPVAVPSIESFDDQGKAFSLLSLKGKCIIIVFNRGFKCEHCSLQLQALLKAKEKLGNPEIVVVSDQIVRNDYQNKQGSKLEFTVLPDPTKSIFRRFGCVDNEQPMHGVFIVDRSGIVRWQNVDNYPFGDIEYLVSKVSQILNGP